MNYSDFDVIQGDSFIGSKFGEQSQLEVIGWSGRKVSHKIYILKCSTCAEDSELCGDGLFTSTKGALVKGHLPCLCAKNFRMTEEQNIVRVNREAVKRDIEFLGWADGFKGARDSFLVLKCAKHGIWKSAQINNFLKGIGCPTCGLETKAISRKIPQDVMISRFMSTGKFVEGTTFTRSEKVNQYGWKSYWEVSCSVCCVTATSLQIVLLSGGMSCGCTMQNQTYSYINSVTDKDTVVALKFGITSNIDRRIKQQNFKCPFTIKNLFSFRFEKSSDCKESELEIKSSMITGILSKSDMPDGYTETTYTYNLENIIAVYEKHGGVMQ